MSEDNELVMYIVARADLGMSPGKLAAQVGHAVHYAVSACREDVLDAWENQSCTKVVLKVDSLEALHAVRDAVGLGRCVMVRDQGRTEIEPATVTAAGIVPMTKAEARPLVGHLKLYR